MQRSQRGQLLLEIIRVGDSGPWHRQRDHGAVAQCGRDPRLGVLMRESGAATRRSSRRWMSFHSSVRHRSAVRNRSPSGPSSTRRLSIPCAHPTAATPTHAERTPPFRAFEAPRPAAAPAATANSAATEVHQRRRSHAHRTGDRRGRSGSEHASDQGADVRGVGLRAVPGAAVEAWPAAAVLVEERVTPATGQVALVPAVVSPPRPRHAVILCRPTAPRPRPGSLAGWRSLIEPDLDLVVERAGSVTHREA